MMSKITSHGEMFFFSADRISQAETERQYSFVMLIIYVYILALLVVTWVKRLSLPQRPLLLGYPAKASAEEEEGEKACTFYRLPRGSGWVVGGGGGGGYKCQLSVVICQLSVK